MLTVSSSSYQSYSAYENSCIISAVTLQEFCQVLITLITLIIVEILI